MGTDLRLTVTAKQSDDGETGGCQFCDRHTTLTGRELPKTEPHTVYVVASERKAGVSPRAIMCRFCIADLFAGAASALRAPTN